MEETNFRKYEKDLELQRLRVEAIGRIVLLADAGRNEFVLASIKALKTLAERLAEDPEIDNLEALPLDPLFDELSTTMYVVTKYRLWDRDKSTSQPPIFSRTNTLKSELSDVHTHLVENRLIENSQGYLSLTDLGQTWLNKFELPRLETEAEL